MADSRFNFGKPAKPAQPQPPARPDIAAFKAKTPQISCRATNPLSLDDNLEKVFLDENQAKATTATRLFRNDELFAATQRAFAEFAKRNRSGKFCMWSTGCSSGEEVYSMAMVVLNEFTKARRQPLLEAFGTDINPQRIAEAKAGLYGRPSKDAFDANCWRLLTTYAEVGAGGVQMGDLLRSVCGFRLFDMRNKPKKHTFHFIVCNHVLQYYDAPGQRHIIGNLVAVLKPGGLLYLEGVTSSGLHGADLEKLHGVPNLYAVGSPSIGGRITRIFRK